MEIAKADKDMKHPRLPWTDRVLKKVQHLQLYSKKWWYQPLMGILAGLDHYVVVIPVDGLLVSSVLLNPKKWFSLAIFFTVGSSLGALGFLFILDSIGIDRLMALFPMIFESRFWTWAQDFFQSHGSWIVLGSGVSPFPQQPAVIVTGLAQVPFWTIAGMLVTGRFIKFMFIAYVSSHAPKKLSKLWGIQGELEEMHIPLKKINEKPVQETSSY